MMHSSQELRGTADSRAPFQTRLAARVAPVLSLALLLAASHGCDATAKTSNTTARQPAEESLTNVESVFVDTSYGITSREVICFISDGRGFRYTMASGSPPVLKLYKHGNSHDVSRSAELLSLFNRIAQDPDGSRNGDRHSFVIVCDGVACKEKEWEGVSGSIDALSQAAVELLESSTESKEVLLGTQETMELSKGLNRYFDRSTEGCGDCFAVIEWWETAWTHAK